MRTRKTRRLAAVMMVASVVLTALLAAGCGGKDDNAARAGEVIFKQKCVACHTVGQGDRIGPDLAGATKRRDRDWLKRWMKDPVNMAKTDPIGQELLVRFKNVPMPPPGLSDADVDNVLEYLGSE